MATHFTAAQNPEAFIMAWLEDGLGVMKKFKPKERSETTRQWAIAITEMEKLVAYWKYTLSTPVEEGTSAESRFELREVMADVQHQIWAHWMEYLFSKCDLHPDIDGVLIIPAESVNHWMRQVSTKYGSLTEQEKDSDREQADKVYKAVHQAIYQDAPIDTYFESEARLNDDI